MTASKEYQMVFPRTMSSFQCTLNIFLSIQLHKNFLFAKVKLKLHGFYKVKNINVLFQRRRHPIEKLLQTIPQISLEQLLIVLLFDQAVDLELAVNFVKFFRTILCRTAANGCLWTIIGVVVNVLEIKN